MTDPFSEARSLLSRLAAAEEAVKRDNEGAAVVYIEARGSLGSPALVAGLCDEIERLREYRKAAERYMRAKERMMPMPWEWVQQEYDEAEAQLTTARAATAPQ